MMDETVIPQHQHETWSGQDTITPSTLGVLRVRLPDGTLQEFRGNRAERRKVIKEYRLKRMTS